MSYQHGGMVFRPGDDGIEDGNNDECSGQCGVPLVADGTVDSKGMFEGKIDNSNQRDVEADDDEGSEGDVGDNGRSETIKNFTTIQHTKEK